MMFAWSGFLWIPCMVAKACLFPDTANKKEIIHFAVGER